MTAKRAPNAFLLGNRVSVRDIPNRKSMAVRQRRRDEFARGESAKRAPSIAAVEIHVKKFIAA